MHRAISVYREGLPTAHTERACYHKESTYLSFQDITNFPGSKIADIKLVKQCRLDIETVGGLTSHDLPQVHHTPVDIEQNASSKGDYCQHGLRINGTPQL